MEILGNSIYQSNKRFRKNYSAQEHGILKVEQQQVKSFQVGDLVEIIPVHSCLTANLMGHHQTTDGEVIEMIPRY